MACPCTNELKFNIRFHKQRIESRAYESVANKMFYYLYSVFRSCSRCHTRPWRLVSERVRCFRGAIFLCRRNMTCYFNSSIISTIQLVFGNLFIQNSNQSGEQQCLQPKHYANCKHSNRKEERSSHCFSSLLLYF